MSRRRHRSHMRLLSRCQTQRHWKMAYVALCVLADMVLHDDIDQQAMDRLDKLSLDGLGVALQRPGSLARYVIDRVVYGSSDRGLAAAGTMETVGANQRDGLTTLSQNFF